MGWTYTAHDGFGGLPEAGQGMRAVKAFAAPEVTLDFPPSAWDDWYADTAGKTLQVPPPGLLVNDREPTAGQTLSAAVLSLPSHGTVDLKSDGSFSYTPVAGWSGTDAFRYLSRGGGGACDTATVAIRVLDPAKVVFHAPPKAKDWRIYSAWGTVSVADLPTGMAMNHSQWGGMSTWIVGSGAPLQVTAEEHTVLVLVRNDAASPWSALKFHLTTQNAVGNYGPTDTATDTLELSAQPAGADGFTELRGSFVPRTAGTYIPALQFVWRDTDGNGPNSNHQSVVRDMEICASKYISATKPTRTGPRSGIWWNMAIRGVTVASPGQTVRVQVTDLRGRLLADVTDKNAVHWARPAGAGAVVVSARAGRYECRFTAIF
jgi:hypothetical protein